MPDPCGEHASETQHSAPASICWFPSGSEVCTRPDHNHDHDGQWAMRTLAATLADTVDAYEAVLWLAKDRDIDWDAAPAAVLRGLDHAEAWDAERRAVEKEANRG